MQTLHRRLLGAALTALLVSLAATALALGQDGEEIVITDTLEPARLEVPAGTEVTWRNEDRERHRIRSRQGPVEFDSGNLEPGERFSITFVVAGEYPYLDERDDADPAYHGTVVVSGAQGADGPPPTVATVTLIDESFQPPAVEVAVGAVVTWENIDGDDDHTVTSTEGVFDSGVLPAGSSFEHGFDAPGAYPYFCAIHPEMTGTITVVGEAPASTASLPSPVAVETPSPGAGGSPEVIATGERWAVSIVDLTYQPTVVEVVSGDVVTWSADDAVPHTVTARDADFDSGVLTAGDTFEQSFETPGTYEYFCTIHPSMTGTVVVGEASGAGGPAGDPSVVSEVSVVDVAFQPAEVTVPAGTTVDWANEDPFAHTVTARDGAFDSGTLDGGETFSRRFETPGAYEYFCVIHPSMTGTVTVTP
jgi:plastocyanin